MLLAGFGSMLMFMVTWRGQAVTVYDYYGKPIAVPLAQQYARYSFGLILAVVCLISLTGLTSGVPGNPWLLGFLTFVVTLSVIWTLVWWRTLPPRPFFRPAMNRLVKRKPPKEKTDAAPE